MDVDGHFNFLAKACQNGHQTIDCKAVQLHLPDTRKIRRSNARQLMRLAYRQLAVVQHADDPGGKQCAKLLAVGIWMIKIAEHIAAPADKLKILIAHFNLSLNCFSRT